MKAAGLFDFLRNPVEHIKEFIEPVPTKLNNISTKTLNEYGNNLIKRMMIIRSPLKSHWENALNVISMGKLKELQNKYGFDKLFHLSLIVEVQDEHGLFHNIIIEKNEVVHIAPFDKQRYTDEKTEYLNVPINKNITLNELINNTKKSMGDKLFYDYDAFGTNGKPANNCQNFLLHIINSNGLGTNETTKFIYQDISKITKHLNNSEFNYVPQAVYNITRLGSHVSRLLGKGKDKIENNIKISNDLKKFIDDGGFAFI